MPTRTFVYHKIKSVIYWPARAMIAPFKYIVNGPITKHREVSLSFGYEPLLRFNDIVFNSSAWTKVEFEFEFLFNGGEDEFVAWVRTPNGRGSLIDNLISLQNFFIDHLKASYPFNENIQNIRHFGPAEWPCVICECGGKIILVRFNPSLRAEISSEPLSVEMEGYKQGLVLPMEVRGLHRACDLAECGYPTEALLVCASMLDAVVQRVIVEGMKLYGVSDDAANDLLRNTTTSRMATYLDPLLKLTYGRSMKEDDLTLFGNVKLLNGRRNDAIHRGQEIKRSEAREACVCLYDVFHYLNSVSTTIIQLSTRPVFA